MDDSSASCEVAWFAVGRILLHPLAPWLATDAERGGSPAKSRRLPASQASKNCLLSATRSPDALGSPADARAAPGSVGILLRLQVRFEDRC